MEIYNKLKTPPQDVLKKIEGGRLKGKFDISPQWRIEILTEVFGAIGFGWKYEITEIAYPEGSDGQTACMVQINLYVKHNNVWSDAIPGQGGSMFIQKERDGLYTNDEAEKMAVTDAIGVAAKQLGVAADVYRGFFDTKYATSKEPAKPEQKEELTPTHARWRDAVKHMAKGGDINAILKTYTISTENLKVLKDVKI